MIFRVLGAAVLGIVGYRLLKPKKQRVNAAYADNQPHRLGTEIRDAGPEAMRDPTGREWTPTDEDLDESFPASDPPGNY